MALYWDERGNLRALDERNNLDANQAVRASCKQNGIKCAVVDLIDVKRLGFKIVDEAAVSKK